MKTLKITMIMFGILAMISCKDSDKKHVVKEHVAIDTPNYDTDRTKDMNTTPEMNNTTDNTLNADKAVVVQDPYIAFNTANMKDMYRNLDMTPDQVNRFETDFNKKMDAMKHDTKMSFDKNKLEREKDQSLKSAVSEKQYKKYEQWKKDHSNM